jgi:hypothetical protein
VHRKYIPFDIFPTTCNITQFISGKVLYMFRVVSPPIIRSTHNCIYSIWYLLNRYCYLSLLWLSWNWFECDVGNVFIWHQNRSIQYSQEEYMFRRQKCICHFEFSLLIFTGLIKQAEAILYQCLSHNYLFSK